MPAAQHRLTADDCLFVISQISGGEDEAGTDDDLARVERLSKSGCFGSLVKGAISLVQDPTLRQVLHYRYVDRWRMDMIAELMCMPEDEVRRLWWQGHAAFREQFVRVLHTASEVLATS